MRPDEVGPPQNVTESETEVQRLLHAPVRKDWWGYCDLLAAREEV